MTRRTLSWICVLLAAAAIASSGLWWRERRLTIAHRDAAECWRVVHRFGTSGDAVVVVVSSHPTATVLGQVRRAEEREQLKDALQQSLGADVMSRVSFNVRVEPTATRPSTEFK